MKVRWSRNARLNLEALRDYIAQDSEMNAARFTARLVASTRRLERHPRIGRRVPEARGSVAEIRELLYRNYRILYRVGSDHVGILAVVHRARDLQGADPKPWEFE